MDNEGRAGMRTISVSSPREITWGRPPADRRTIDELLGDQIPVSVSTSRPDELGGKLAERIDIESIEQYQAKVFEKLNTKSILSFQPIPEDELFFDLEVDQTPEPLTKE